MNVKQSPMGFNTALRPSSYLPVLTHHNFSCNLFPDLKCIMYNYIDPDLSIALSSLLSMSSFLESRLFVSCRRFSSPSSSDLISELTEEVLWPWRPPDSAARVERKDPTNVQVSQSKHKVWIKQKWTLERCDVTKTGTCCVREALIQIHIAAFFCCRPSLNWTLTKYLLIYRFREECILYSCAKHVDL